MAEKLAPDLSEQEVREFMVGSEWLEWRNDPRTLKFVQGLRDTTGDFQDAWLNKRFVGDDKEGLVMLGEARAYTYIADRIKNIQMDEKKE